MTWGTAVSPPPRTRPNKEAGWYRSWGLEGVFVKNISASIQPENETLGKLATYTLICSYLETVFMLFALSLHTSNSLFGSETLLD